MTKYSNMGALNVEAPIHLKEGFGHDGSQL